MKIEEQVFFFHCFFLHHKHYINYVNKVEGGTRREKIRAVGGGGDVLKKISTKDGRERMRRHIFFLLLGRTGWGRGNRYTPFFYYYYCKKNEARWKKKGRWYSFGALSSVQG